MTIILVEVRPHSRAESTYADAGEARGRLDEAISHFARVFGNVFVWVEMDELHNAMRVYVSCREREAVAS